MTKQLNNFLTGKFEEKEIQAMMFEMEGYKSLVLDGFLGYFFQTFWEIMHKDILVVVHGFQENKTMPKDMISIVVALIQKEMGANYFSKFHPISLCNFLNKVIL